MISITVTGYLKKRLGSYYKFYRLFFNLFAFSTLIPLILYSLSLRERIIFRWEGSLIIIQIALLIIAMSLFVAGALKYDMLRFLGIRQVKSGKSFSTLSESGDIDTSGVLGITRHPWYLGAIIFIWIYYREMYVSTLLVNIILTIYLLIGTVLEERKLVMKFGDRYRDYRKRVSMLFPAKWIVSKLSGAKWAC